MKPTILLGSGTVGMAYRKGKYRVKICSFSVYPPYKIPLSLYTKAAYEHYIFTGFS